MFEPVSLLRQCLGVIEKLDVGPEERYQIFEYLLNVETPQPDEKIKILINFVTELTYEEIFDLKVETNKRDELLKFIFDNSFRVFQDF